MKQTRVRWTDVEKAKVAERFASIYKEVEGTTEEVRKAIEDAQYILEASRRRPLGGAGNVYTIRKELLSIAKSTAAPAAESISAADNSTEGFASLLQAQSAAAGCPG